MSNGTFSIQRLVVVFVTLFTAFPLVNHAGDPMLTGPVRQADGSIEVAITGDVGLSVTLQGSGDMKGWSDVQTFQLAGTPAVFRQNKSGQGRYQYFRLKSSGTIIPVPPTLVDLSTLPNSVFVAGEGFDTVQFAPNGTLGMIFWKDRNLTYRERSTSGQWAEQVVPGGGNLFQASGARDYKFQPAALLLFDSNSQPHVFRALGGKTIGHFVRSGGAWAEMERIENGPASAAVDTMVGSLGPNNTFHLAVISGGDSPNLTYGSNRSGEWSWNQISPVGPSPKYFFAPSYAPRWLSLAVDSNSNAHITFRPEYRLPTTSTGHLRPYNELAYASNRSGQWRVQIVQKPRDDSGEAGNGSSIAIGPDNKPYIASWYNERGPGGSSESSRLFFHSQDASGNWTAQEVISRPDGYIAGDNEKGTGFAPYLRFDTQGRPHILFLDHGSEHFSQAGQIEYSGHIRHAVLQSGWQWQVESVFRQSDPLRNQMVYPAFAMSGSELVVTGLQRATVWNMAAYPPAVSSTYRFTTVTMPLR